MTDYKYWDKFQESDISAFDINDNVNKQHAKASRETLRQELSNCNAVKHLSEEFVSKVCIATVT